MKPKQSKKASSQQRLNIYKLLADYTKVDSSQQANSLVSIFKKVGKRKQQFKEKDAWFYNSIIAMVEQQNISVIDAFGSLIPEDEFMAIQTVKADNISEGLALAIGRVERKKDLSSTLILIIGYPLFSAAIAVAVLYINLVSTVPAYSSILDPSKWPSSAQNILVYYAIIVEYGILSLIVATLAVVGIMFSMRVRHIGFRNVLDKIPPWSIQKRMMAAVFIESFGEQLKAEVPPSIALQKIHKLSAPYLRVYIEKMQLRLTMNYSLEEVFDVGLFDRETMGRIRDFSSRKAQFPTILAGIGEQSFEKAKMTIKVFAFLFGLGLMLFGSMSNTYISLSGQSIQDEVKKQYLRRR